MMKSAFRCVQIVLLFYGVFGADEDEVKAVSVMEGDSVTLHRDLTQIKTFYLIEWRFRDPVIAQIDRNYISYPNHTEIFRGRLQLDQTGSLTIKNMKTKHAGLYELKISHSDGTAERKFNVTVYESPSDPGESEMKSESVTSGDRVTLQTGVTPLSGDELIVWRFGDEGKVIAKADKEAKSSPLYYDERFGDRLELDQTGSLIITDTRSTDSGFYSVKISSNKQTLHKRFSVSVSEPGLSPGVKAGIVVAVLLVLAAAAAAAVGFIYYRRKISELQKQILTVTRTKGEDVILKPNKTIQKGDVILWMFGEGEQRTSIAKLIGETREIVTHDYAVDGRFSGRLKLDTTGSLTIKNSRPAHSGLYTLYITSSSGDSEQRFIVTVSENEKISVDEEGTVTLKPDTEIQKDDLIQWMSGKQDVLIAQIRGETVEICDDVLDGRFRGRLKMDKTGSLTITNIKLEHIGLYKLQIISSRGTLCKRFSVYYPWRHVPVTAGESVHLFTDRPKIERDDVIQWRFGDEIIAEIKEETGKTHDGADGRFRDRLQLDKRTGDLTIKSSTDEDAGDYKLKIRSSKGNTNKNYMVTITVRDVSVTVGESVHLPTDRPEIERDDVIQWRCGDEIIAEIKGGTGETHDERFRGRLQLDKRTGDLTIKRCTATDTGYYNLKIRSSKGNTNKIYAVTIRGRDVSVTVGESVHLSTDRPKIERDDVIQWRFEDEIIAEIKGGTGETHDGADDGRFRDRLQLNDQTGDLTIKNSTAEDEGDYKLKIRSSKGNTNRIYCVFIKDKPREESLMKGNNDESVVEMQPLMIK